MMANKGARIAAASRRYPPMWVIYDHPRDYPDNFVVRCWYGTEAELHCKLADSIEHARALVVNAGGCWPLGRMDNDDRAIVEVWL